MKKIFALLIVATGLSACLPYNSYYSTKPAYYQAGYYDNSQVYSHNFEQGLNENYNYNNQNIDEMPIIPENLMQANNQQQNIYQDFAQTGNINNYPSQSKPYYNPNLMPNSSMPMVNEDARGVVGIGQMLEKNNYTQNSNSNGYEKSSNKLIVPHAWRMSHPSIGKGLELANQQERLDINKALTMVSIKKPIEIKIAEQNVSVISLANSSSANSNGYLCKDVYLVKANRENVDKMWGKFCRHPNWNEWVLTAW